MPIGYAYCVTQSTTWHKRNPWLCLCAVEWTVIFYFTLKCISQLLKKIENAFFSRNSLFAWHWSEYDPYVVRTLNRFTNSPTTNYRWKKWPVRFDRFELRYITPNGIKSGVQLFFCKVLLDLRFSLHAWRIDTDAWVAIIFSKCRR